MSKILRSIICLALFWATGSAFAAGYVCETRRYTQCNDGYYLSDCGSKRDGSIQTTVAGNSCLPCPSGYKCTGTNAVCPTADTVTVTLNHGGGKSSLNTITYKGGSWFNGTLSITSVPIPTRAGYTFTGYYTPAEFSAGGGRLSTSGGTVTMGNSPVGGDPAVETYAGIGDLGDIGSGDLVVAGDRRIDYTGKILTDWQPTADVTATAYWCQTCKMGTGVMSCVTTPNPDGTCMHEAICNSGYETPTCDKNGNCTCERILVEVTLNDSDNGGSGGSGKVYFKKSDATWYADVNGTQKITKVTIPTKAGATFAGYYDSAKNSGSTLSRVLIPDTGIFVTNTASFNYYAPTADETIYARFTDCTACTAGTGVASCSAVVTNNACNGWTATCSSGYSNPKCDTSGNCTCELSNVTITLNPNGGAFGSMANTRTCTYGATCTLPKYATTSSTLTGNGTITKPNSVFLGWADTSNATSPKYTDYQGTFTKSTTLFAVWGVPLCDTVKVANGTVDTVASAVKSIVDNKLRCDVTCATGFSKSGGNNTTTSFTNSGEAGSSDNVTNECLPRVYMISLDYTTNGGTSGTSSIYEKYTTGWYTSYSATTAIETISTPRKTGYTFTGYWTSATGGTNVIPASGSLSGLSNTRFTEETTLYAQFTPNAYTITLNANSGTFVSMASSVTCTHGVACDLPKYAATANTTTGDGIITKANSVFLGWADSRTATSPTYTDYQGTFTAAKTIYAVWGTVACGIGDMNLDGTSSVKSSVVSVENNALRCDVTCNDGYSKSGGTDATTTFAEYGEPGVASTKLSSCQPRVYTITLSPNGGTGGTTTIYEKYATGWYSNSTATAMISSVTPPTKSGSVFTGYWTSSTGGTNVIPADGSLIGLSNGHFTANTTLYARWSTPTCGTITGGTQSSVSVSGNKPQCNITCSTGYSQTGGTNTTNTKTCEGTAGSTDAVDCSCSPRTFTVSFDLNKGSGTKPGNVTATYDADMPKLSTTTAPTRTGYTFMGWYDNTTYTSGTQYYTATGASATKWNKTAGATLYAGWKINSYTCTSGQYLPAGATACATCLAGYKCPSSNVTYEYDSDENQGLTPCSGANEWQDQTGQTTCKTVTDGKIKKSDSELEDCGKDNWCKSGVRTACTANSTTGTVTTASAITACSCQDGFGGNAATSGGTCTQCAGGTYKEGISNTTCDDCGDGYYCSGGSNRKACPTADSGWTAHTTSTKATSYTACYENKTDISDFCTAGELRRAASSATAYSTMVTKSTALRAVAGAYVDDQTCRQCTTGTFSAGGTVTACNKCEDLTPAVGKTGGTYSTSPANGATASTACRYVGPNISTPSGCYNVTKNTVLYTGSAWGTGLYTVTAAKGYRVGTATGVSPTCSICTSGTFNATDGTTSTTCSACPSGYSGSDTLRDSNTKCYVSCTAKTISNGTTTPVNTKEYYTGSKYPACTFNVNCNETYGASGDQTENPACSLCNNGQYSAGGTATCQACPANYQSGAAGAKQADCTTSCAAGTQVASANAACTTPNTANWYTSAHTVNYGSTSGTNVKSCNTTNGYGNSGTTATSHAEQASCKVTCSEKMYVASAGGACVTVGTGYYGAGGTVSEGSTGSRSQCPANYRTGAAGAKQTDCTTSCAAGTVVASANNACSTPSGNNWYSVAHTVNYGSVSNTTNQKYSCASGYTTANTATKTDHDEEEDCKITCSAGQYVSAARGACVAVGDGYFAPSTTVSQGDTGSRSSCPSGYNHSDTGAAANTNCYITVDAGKYKTSETGSTTNNCGNWSYSAQHNSYYNSADSCTTCPTLTSGWAKADSTGTGWQNYTSCVQTHTPSGCASGTTKQTAISSSAWGTEAANTTLSANSGNYVSGITCPACSGVASGAYPLSDGGNITSANCYVMAEKTGSQKQGTTPAGCASVTAWNTCNPGTCEYKDYYTATDETCTPTDCTQTPKTVTAQANYYANSTTNGTAATCPLCSSVGGGFYPNSAAGNSGGAKGVCKTNDLSGQYVASANATSATDCAENTWKGSHQVAYGSTSSCTPCPTGYGVASGAGTAESSCAITCAGGSYLKTAKDASCTDVGVGYWAASQSVNYGSTSTRNQCAAGLKTRGYGPGADEAGDCGRILHAGGNEIYLRSEKKTTPSLNVNVGGATYYGNMSTESKGGLKILYNKEPYSVYDDGM